MFIQKYKLLQVYDGVCNHIYLISKSLLKLTSLTALRTHIYMLGDNY